MQPMAVRQSAAVVSFWSGTWEGEVHVADGRATGAAGAGPAWWSDALNDPWRNPESHRP